MATKLVIKIFVHESIHAPDPFIVDGIPHRQYSKFLEDHHFFLRKSQIEKVWLTSILDHWWRTTHEDLSVLVGSVK